MATKNIEININNGNGYDTLYPKTVMANITDWQNNVYSKSQTYSRSEITNLLKEFKNTELGSYIGTEWNGVGSDSTNSSTIIFQKAPTKVAIFQQPDSWAITTLEEGKYNGQYDYFYVTAIFIQQGEKLQMPLGKNGRIVKGAELIGDKLTVYNDIDFLTFNTGKQQVRGYSLNDMYTYFYIASYD